MNWSNRIAASALMLTLGITPAGAETAANFGTLTLNSNHLSGRLSGTVGGSVSLPAIVSNRDRHNNNCLGFGTPNPDHILVLQQDLPALKVQVRSSKLDTTLAIQGSDGSVRCADDNGNSKDATLTDADWKAGIYKVWVGTATPGLQQDYTLVVTAPSQAP